ncbi:MAG: GAF domain-containing protein, partial [Anaerolineales bacterium]|nr:GAF domain-containing protein [Anaerolineales bacterium]
MKIFGRPADYCYRLLVAVAGLVLLLLFSLSFSLENGIVGAFLVVVFFIAFLVNYPLVLFQREFHLAFIITIGSGLIYGPVPAAWATLLGVVGGQLFYQWRMRPRPESSTSSSPIDWVTLLYRIGAQVIPLMVVLNITGWKTGLATDNTHYERVWAFIAIVVIFYIVVHAVIHLSEVAIRSGFRQVGFRRNLFIFLVIEFLPVLFIILVVDAFSAIGASAIFLLGGMPAIIAVLMDSMFATQLDLQRRVQELSTLNHVSRTLRSTLDLQALLTGIHLQVTGLLGVDSFYVALYDKTQNELWYPLAVKFGVRQDWQRRSVSDRLTDRVILEKRPILLAPETATPVGLPPSEETPTSWLGVPLISQEQAIGCLGVFDVDERIAFTQADQDLLSILSGQVSVAIENALLYEQAQERAGQLETLNRLTGTLTASLDPQQVLEQVCIAVSLVSGARQSAVFLLDAGDDLVYLAYAPGMSDGFRIRNRSFSITSSRRTRCLRTARPVYVDDINQSSLALDLLHLFQVDNIQAFADFPLITPDGQIGFLSVYYNQPHEFQRAEIELLQTLASQAAMAVSNARLHARTDQASER